jgi:hypothetical protein
MPLHSPSTGACERHGAACWETRLGNVQQQEAGVMYDSGFASPHLKPDFFC